MPITVRVDAETEKLLDRLSRTKGWNKSEIVREAIRLLAVRETSSVYDRISDLVGSVDSKGLNPSVDAHKRAAKKIQGKHGRSR